MKILMNYNFCLQLFYYIKDKLPSFLYVSKYLLFFSTLKRNNCIDAKLNDL